MAYTIEELCNINYPEYQIMVTNDGVGWFALGGWYISVKKAISSLNKSSYPPRWENYKEIYYVTKISTKQATKLNLEDFK